MPIYKKVYFRLESFVLVSLYAELNCNEPFLTAYSDDPSNSQRDSGFYSRQMPQPDPRNRMSKHSEEFYFDDYYDEEEYDEDYDDETDDSVDRPVPIWLGIMLVVVYIFGGAFLFSKNERWNFLDSVYFCFITLTTIGKLLLILSMALLKICKMALPSSISLEVVRPNYFVHKRFEKNST